MTAADDRLTSIVEERDAARFEAKLLREDNERLRTALKRLMDAAPLEDNGSPQLVDAFIHALNTLDRTRDEP